MSTTLVSLELAAARRIRDLLQAASTLRNAPTHPTVDIPTWDDFKVKGAINHGKIRVTWYPVGRRNVCVITNFGDVSMAEVFTSVGEHYQMTINAAGELITAWRHSPYGHGKIELIPIFDGDPELEKILIALPVVDSQ